MKPIHQNEGGYEGERIAIHSVLNACSLEARRLGFRIDSWGESPSHIGLIRQPATDDARSLYISAGIHGDEPAGPLSVLRALRDIHLPATLGILLVPCINPHGFEHNQREDETGRDLNRDYRNPTSSTTRRHIEWLRRLPRLDLCICLHEDWEADGFYFYELVEREDSTSFGAHVSQRFKDRGYPMQDTPVIEGLQARDSQIRRVFNPDDMSDWPEAFFIMQEKASLTFTTETPSRYSLSDRVSMQTFFIQQAIEFLDESLADAPVGKAHSESRD